MEKPWCGSHREVRERPRATWWGDSGRKQSRSAPGPGQCASERTGGILRFCVLLGKSPAPTTPSERPPLETQATRFSLRLSAPACPHRLRDLYSPLAGSRSRLRSSQRQSGWRTGASASGSVKRATIWEGKTASRSFSRGFAVLGTMGMRHPPVALSWPSGPNFDPPAQAVRARRAPCQSGRGLLLRANVERAEILRRRNSPERQLRFVHLPQCVRWRTDGPSRSLSICSYRSAFRGWRTCALQVLALWLERLEAARVAGAA